MATVAAATGKNGDGPRRCTSTPDTATESGKLPRPASMITLITRPSSRGGAPLPQPESCRCYQRRTAGVAPAGGCERADHGAGAQARDQCSIAASTEPGVGERGQGHLERAAEREVGRDHIDDDDLEQA